MVDGTVKTQPKKIPRAGEVQCRRNPFGGFKDCDGRNERTANGMMVAAAFWDDQVNSDLGHSELVLNATGGTGEKFCPNPVMGAGRRFGSNRGSNVVSSRTRSRIQHPNMPRKSLRDGRAIIGGASNVARIRFSKILVPRPGVARPLG